MTRSSRTASALAALGVAVLTLSACSDPEPAGDPAPVSSASGTDAGTDDTSTSPSDDTSGTTGTGAPDDTASTTASDGAVAGLPPRPEPDRCATVPEAADGVYTVYEAGTATVTVADGRLVLGEVQAADGWTSRVDDEGADEVEIDFRLDGATDVLDLEIEIDDGRVDVQICNDDD